MSSSKKRQEPEGLAEPDFAAQARRDAEVVGAKHPERLAEGYRNMWLAGQHQYQELRELLIEAVEIAHPQGGPTYTHCPWCDQWMHIMNEKTRHHEECFIIRARKFLGQEEPALCVRPPNEVARAFKREDDAFNARWGFSK
jgi:hypothetical protein